MPKITRKTAKLFAASAAGTDVEQFASFTLNGVPTYTTSPAVIMASPAWTLGWSATQFDGQFAPYFQDRNGVDLVFFYQIAYLLQQGIAEYDAGTNYFTRSVVQSGGGIYISLQDNNAGNTPPAGASNSFWQLCAFPSANPPKNPTRTVLTSSSGTYTPPAGCVRIFVRMVGAGGGGGPLYLSGHPSSGSPGGDTTFGTVTAGGGSGAAGLQDASGGFSAGVAGGAASGGDININGAFSRSTSSGQHLGPGAVSKFGGGSGFYAAIVADFGPVAQPNSGSGGGAVYRGSSVSTYPTGGAAGAYAEKTFYGPFSAGFAYAVGVGGGGGGNINAYGGGNGGSGIIVVDEHYY